MTEKGSSSSSAYTLRLANPAGATITLAWHALTHVGKLRENNQDSFVAEPPLFAVADGMGGHSAGEVASAAVARRLAELATATGKSGAEASFIELTEKDINSALEKAVEDIELETGETDLGAGTTVTGAAIGPVVQNKFTWRIFNIGDSRVYQHYRGVLSQVTVDHSVVQHLLDTGQITQAEMETHPHANVITRAVGFDEEPWPDYVLLGLVPGQRILICSDGLTKELTDAGLQHFLNIQNPKEAAAQLLEQALLNSGRDNITLVIVDVLAAEHPQPE